MAVAAVWISFQSGQLSVLTTRGYGAMAACLTPDQKVGSSNLSGLISAAVSNAEKDSPYHQGFTPKWTRTQLHELRPMRVFTRCDRLTAPLDTAAYRSQLGRKRRVREIERAGEKSIVCRYLCASTISQHHASHCHWFPPDRSDAQHIAIYHEQAKSRDRR